MKIPLDEFYDPIRGLIGRTVKTPGYHTRVADGTFAHDIRFSMDYALSCLASGDAAAAHRATRVIETVLALQDRDPMSPTFGIWPWYAEESLSEMNPPDWNWADFIGARLAEALIQFRDRLDSATVTSMSAAIDCAAMCIFRRNVAPSYTNIAIMGAGVSLAAGELLGRDVLIQYGTQKLRAVLALAKASGSFAEYNSPTYTVVAIEECERILAIVKREPARLAAVELFEIAWRMIAEHWHAPTQQWAGPHGRAYSDCLNEATLARIRLAVGGSLPGPGTAAHHARPRNLRDCPTHLRQFFLGSSPTPRKVQFALAETAEGHAKVGTTWFGDRCVLGSMSRECTWDQRRSIIAYWPSETGTAVFTVRWLMDGRPMPGVRLAVNQSANSLLIAAYPLYGCGVFHPYFGVPEGAIFRASDLRLRFQVEGTGVCVEHFGSLTFALSCSEHQICVTACADSTFNGAPVTWDTGGCGDARWLDAVCVSGAARDVSFKTLSMRLAAGVQLLTKGSRSSAAAIAGSELSDMHTFSWPKTDLENLTVPVNAQPFTL